MIGPELSGWSLKCHIGQFANCIDAGSLAGLPKDDRLTWLHLVAELSDQPMFLVTDLSTPKLLFEIPHIRVGLKEPCLLRRWRSRTVIRLWQVATQFLPEVVDNFRHMGMMEILMGTNLLCGSAD